MSTSAIELISTLNLEYKTKIGNRLNANQVNAIKSFYQHVKDNLQPDECGIYKAAFDELNFQNLNIDELCAGLISEEQQITLSTLYRKILDIYNNNKTDLVIQDNDQTKITRACDAVIKTLNITSPEFEQYEAEKTVKYEHLTEKNKQEVEELQEQGANNEQLLTLILKCAVGNTDKNTEDADKYIDNYSLTKTQINIIKDALGSERFEFLCARYNLTPTSLSLDGVRMLIIGTIGNINEASLHTPFFQHLCYAIDVDTSNPANQLEPETNLKKQLQMVSKLSNSILDYHSEQQAIKRIKSAPPTHLLDKIINWVRECMPNKWRFIISERLKVNANFVNDLKTATLAANATLWQRNNTTSTSNETAIEKTKADTTLETEHPEASKEQSKKSTEQLSASYEYLFHKIAYQNINEDGTIIPVVEPNGEIAYYKAYNLINKAGLVGLALVPYDANKTTLDVKVLFRGTHGIGGAILDAEKYGAGYQSFRTNEAAIMTKLNEIISKVKTDAETHGQNSPTVSLTVGGHSLGGAITQDFYASLLKAKLYPIYKANINNPKLHELLASCIKLQIEYEISVKYQKPLDPAKLALLVKERTGYLLKSLEKYDLKHKSIKEQKSAQEKTDKHKGKQIAKENAIILQDDNLAAITTVNVATLNAAGIPYKLHDLAADSLAILKNPDIKTKLSIPQPTLNSRCTNIMVGGDVVQQTGQANISAGLPPENITVETIKINSGLEGKAKKQVLIAAAFEVVSFLAMTYIGVKIPLIPWIPNFGDIVSSIKDAHCKLHFEDKNKPVDYEYQSNQNIEAATKQVKNLTTKVPIVNSSAFQTVKKHLVSWLKVIYNKLEPIYKTVKGKEALVSNFVDKIEPHLSTLSKVVEYVPKVEKALESFAPDNLKPIIKNVANIITKANPALPVLKLDIPNENSKAKQNSKTEPKNNQPKKDRNSLRASAPNVMTTAHKNFKAKYNAKTPDTSPENPTKPKNQS